MGDPSKQIKAVRQTIEGDGPPLQRYMNIQYEMLKCRKKGTDENGPYMTFLRVWLKEAREEATKDGMPGIIKQAKDMGLIDGVELEEVE